MSVDRGRGTDVEEELDDQAGAEQPLAGKDFYMDGPSFVFTAAYHLKRGYCCGSGCRHCPYGGAVSDSGE